MQRNIWKVFVVASMLAYTPANARHFPHPVNGVCGSADDVSTTSAPTTNLCSAGTATAVSDIGSSWTWSCVGSKGGSTASCSAPLQQSSGSGSGSGSTSGAAQVPGPSADLFNSPYYQCVNNFYVATTGSDSNDGKTAPWLTLQHADSADVGAGSCINVAPGTYNGVLIHNGGNAATATGYIVYRCQQLDVCIVIGNGGVNGSSAFDTVRTTKGTPPNYVQIDGFEMVGSGTFYPVGVQVFNGGSGIAGHHIWVLNSIVHGFGQSGMQLNDAEYFYAIHNTVFNNSRTQCDAQGSGISLVTPAALPGYSPTADDQNNPNPLIGSFTRSDGQFFHNVVEYNVAYNNALTACGTAASPYDTDGNGIIMDTFGSYPNPTLVAMNVAYNNGGGGVHILNSAHVTVANNTCFNNNLDPYNSGTARPCIDETHGSDGTFINNIAIGIPATVSTCQVNVVPYTQWNNSIIGSASSTPLDTFANNLTDTIGVSCHPEVALFNNGAGLDSYPVPPNIEHTNPGWVDVGTSSVGTETTPPVGTNFALAPGSAAIGAGLTEPYLPASSVDIGACASSLTTCP